MTEEEVTVRLHEQLKNWLIDLGKSVKDKRGADYYSKVWTGDSESLTIQLGNWRDSYSPDVVWKRKDQKCVFEISFTEDWRAVAGEIFLASMVEYCVKVFVIDSLPEGKEPTYENRWKKYVSMLGEKAGLRFGAELILFPENNKIDEIKRLIRERLTPNWVW